MLCGPCSTKLRRNLVEVVFQPLFAVHMAQKGSKTEALSTPTIFLHKGQTRTNDAPPLLCDLDSLDFCSLFSYVSCLALMGLEGICFSCRMQHPAVFPLFAAGRYPIETAM